MTAEAIPNALGPTGGTALGNEWPEILTNWFLANARCEATGIYGYKGEITGLQNDWSQKTVGGPCNLNPGEGIYVRNAEVTGKAGTTVGNLRYENVDTERGVIVNIASTATSDTKTPGEPVALAEIAQEKQDKAFAAGAKTLSAPLIPAREPRPVDRVFRMPE
jgi:hypothetical protein